MGAVGERVMVGLSGGVDSAVAALLLIEQGFRVEALFMKNWEEDDREGHCSAAEDLRDAQRVAAHLGLRLHTANFAAEYWDRVFEHFLAEYQANRTPNPDILCNSEIKFRAFLDHAVGLGAERIATGHYARLRLDTDGAHLCISADENKDQTYFLHLLNQAQLSHARFPLGDLTKAEVRALALRAGLPNHARKDSTGICFIGERRFREFLQRFLPANPGPMVTLEGIEVGRHHGLMYYTLGQRKGLGIGGVRGAAEEPWFVLAKDLGRNRLVVAQGHDHPNLYSPALETGPVHWIAGHAPISPLRCLARLRHRQPLQGCEVTAFKEGRCRVRFDEPQRAVTPGQSIVFYQDGECLGGAVMESAD